MIKNKIIPLLLLTILILPLALTLVRAALEDTASQIQEKSAEIGETIEKAQDTKTAAEEKSEYLREEWRKILLENKFTAPIIKILEPISIFLLGKELIFSWAYFFLLAIFIALFCISYKLLRTMPNINSIVALICSLIIAILSTRFIPKEILEFQMSLLSKITVLMLIILIIFLVYYLSGKIKKEIKKEREQRREEKAKAVEKFHDLELKSRGLKKK